MSFWEDIKPAVQKRTLLLIAGCTWSIAGGILLTRGLVSLIRLNDHLVLELLAGIILGIIFYVFLFTGISGKHILRINLIRIDHPCFFSFFNFRSYMMMAIMITAGITLRKLNVINPDYLYSFYLAMGIPLLASAYRFFYSWYKNRSGL